MNETILSVGGMGVDAVVRVSDLPAEALRATGTGVRLEPGGKAANVALASKRLGARSILVAQLGDDLLADVALTNVRDEGVELWVERVTGHATAFAAIGIAPGKKRTCVFANGATMVWNDSARARALEAVDRARVLVVSLGVPGDVVRALVSRARERGVAVIVDPSPADALGEVVADVILPDADEASELSDVDVVDAHSARVAAHRLRGRGHHIVVIKLPGGGCVAVAPDEAYVIEPPRVQAVDTNGAGDAFAAAFAVAWLERCALRDAARFAVAASAIAVSREGAQSSLPTRAEVDRRVAD